jgi:catechol 2,3-dioxygenase-like lactoylglutathione lyase family enzyme
VAAARQDHGLTHVALPIVDAGRSIAFYERFADMTVVHRRSDPASEAEVVWLSDLTRPFVIVLIETAVSHQLGGFAHLGVGCSSRQVVDERCAVARAEGHEVFGPLDDGPPVGYWAIIADPDGHNLELSHGQTVAFTVSHHEQAGSGEPA